MNAFIPTRTKISETKSAETPSAQTPTDALFTLTGKVIDHKAGLQAAIGKEYFLQELLDMMYDSIPTEIEQLNTAHQKNDWEKICALVHKLNGGTGSCGAIRLGEACTNLVKYLKNGQTELAEKLYQQVLGEMEAFRKEREKMKK